MRRALRRRRRALPPRRRREAALAVARHGAAWPWLRRCAHVAAYWPADGELEPWPLLERLPGLRVLYLPVVRPGGKLWFAPYGPGAACAANRYGIPEPLAPAVPVRVLDVVLLPLVAFDGQGHRLGMGGGYYDRTLAFLRHRRRRRRPRLVGLAYAFQEVAALPAEPWDVPLDAVITEQGLRLFPGP
ncbi:MAG: 5-formyltetrahydrofolate cyclo-ligase [Gammaproteobacteria bacterium]|nr:MAG: 5-formyltetrahydrofolate cyclo-ligase [Gammaproteobacteria bacterium]